MTISIKPTASGSTIEQDGSQVLSIESDRSVDIDSGTLHVDATNNRVGIGTSSPSYTLDINRGGVGPVVKFTGSASAYIYAGSAAVYFGSDATVSNSFGADSVNNRLVMYTNSNERMRIDSSGNLYLNTTTQNDFGRFNINFSSTGPNIGIGIKQTNGGTGTLLNFFNVSTQTGSITQTNTNVSFNTSSDYRLKNNVTSMSGSIDRLKQLKPSTWKWTQDGSHGEGFIAHEAQTVVPEAVSGTKDAMKTEEYEVTPAVLDDNGSVVTEAVMGTREVPVYQGIDQSKLVPLLTAALQEAITKIEALEARVATLEGN